MNRVAQVIVLSIASLAVTALVHANEEAPTLSSLPPGTQLRIDVPPTRFEADLRGVDWSLNSLVLAGSGCQWQGHECRCIPLSSIRGIDLRHGVRRGTYALRGFGVGVLAGGVTGAMMGQSEGDMFAFITATMAGMGGVVGTGIGLAIAPTDWRPVQLDAKEAPVRTEVP